MKYRVLVWGDGVARELNEDVAAFQVRYGELQPNQFGTIYRGGEGAIQLHNDSGDYTSPNPRYESWRVPGDIVYIEAAADASARAGNFTRLFTGTGEGFLTQTPLTQQYISTLPIVGPLNSIALRNILVSRRVNANLLTSEIFDLLLDEVVFSDNRRTIDEGLTRLREHRVNSSGILGQSRQRVPFAQGARLLAQAEGSQIYDDRLGFIIFRSRHHRSLTYSNRAFVAYHLRDAVITNATTGPVRSNVFNVIDSNLDQFVSSGVADLKFTNSPFHNLPVTLQNDGTTEYILEVSDEFAFVQSVLPPSGTGDGVRAEVELAGDLRVRLTLHGTGSYTLRGIEGERFRQSGTRHFSVRSEDSIRIYGERPVTYPADLLSVQGNDFSEVRDRMDEMLALHDGVLPSGEAWPLRQIDVRTLVDDESSALLQLNVGDLIFIEAGKLPFKQVGIDGDFFFVDEYAWSLQEDGDLELSLRLTDARASARFPFDNIQWGNNGATIIGH